MMVDCLQTSVRLIHQHCNLCPIKIRTTHVTPRVTTCAAACVDRSHRIARIIVPAHDRALSDMLAYVASLAPLLRRRNR